MKELAKSRKNKLAKSTTVFLSLFVMALMLLSSTVPAATNRGTSEKVKVNESIFQTATMAPVVKSAGPAPANNAATFIGKSNNQQPAGGMDPTAWLYYDDGTNTNGLGLTSGGTFEEAIRLSPAELGPYAGYKITQVQVYQGYYAGSEPSHDINIKIYAQGTDITPGSVIYTQAFTTVAGPGFQTFVLDTAVAVTGDVDLWVSIEWLNTAAGNYPAGMDAGPAADGKGDWVFLGTSWAEIQIYGFDENFMVRAGVEPGGPAIEHDMKMVSIDAPVTGTALAPIIPKATVKNVGNNTETNVPVNFQISGLSSFNVYNEGFEGTTFPPAGWFTVGSANFVQVSGTGNAQVGTYAAKMYSYGYGYTYQANTPSFDGSGGGNVLTFWHKQQVWAGDQDYLYLYASNDGGMSYYYITGYFSNMDWTFETINLDSILPPTNNMQIVFYGDCEYGYGIFIDEINVNGLASSVIYDNTQIIPSIAVGASTQVSFTGWTPAEWGDSTYENSYVDYGAQAQVQLAGDLNPGNDLKTSSLTLYYPFINDVKTVAVISPTQDGLATTFPVKAKIANVGQMPEKNFFIETNIGEIGIGGTYIDEQWNGYQAVPPGWTDEHKAYSSYYGWYLSYSNQAGGILPEAELPYYYCIAGYKLISPSFNLVGYGTAQLSWKNYINHYSGQGLYTLKAGVSQDDGATWTECWSFAPSSSQQFDVAVPIPGGSATTRIALWVEGNPFYFNYWYIDNVLVQSTYVIPEYNEDQAVVSWLNPGQTLDLTFPDWTPAHLATGISGVYTYGVTTQTELATDTNPANDLAGAQFDLTYTHDVNIKITSPVKMEDKFYAFEAYPDTNSVWFDPATPGVFNVIGAGLSFFCGGCWANGQWWVCDYYGMGLYTVDTDTGVYTLIGNSGIQFNGLAYYSGTLYAAGSYSLYSVDMATAVPTLIGNFNTGGLMIDMAIDGSGNAYGHDIGTDSIYHIDLATGAATLIGPTGLAANYAQGMSYDIPNDILYLAAYTYSGELYTCDVTTGHATLVGAFPSGEEVDALAIPGGGGGPGAPKPTIFVKTGTSTATTGTTKNVGTFPESITAYATIEEYITDPNNGTLVMSGNIPGINLNPLGGEQTLTFDSYNYPVEGVYRLTESVPLANDDKQSDNLKTVGIGSDNTPPVSAYTLTPTAPDGKNSWYVHDVTVKLTATDPTVLGVSSGVAKIQYDLDGSGWKDYSAAFKVTTDSASHIVKYRAIDKVGNTEADKQIPAFKIDKTPPMIVLNKQVTGNKIVYTAVPADNMSGVAYVEFYFNAVLQFTANAPGPYVWTLQPIPNVNGTIRAIAYDLAGLSAYADQSASQSNAQSEQQSAQQLHYAQNR